MTSPAAVSAVFAALGAAAVAVAQPPTTTSTQPVPRFPAQAELVTVDVVVLGPDGKLVSGLTRDDFVVKEDGRPQTLTAFEAVEAVVPALEAPATVTSPSLARLATNVSSPPTRRTFAIVFDDLHVNDLDIEEAKRAVETFVAQEVRSGDRLVLFTTSDARYWATMRDGADDAFVQALRRIRSHERKADPFRTFPMTHYEAMRIEEANDEQVMGLVQRRLGVCNNSAPVGGVTPARTGAGGVQTGGQDEPPIRHCKDAAEVYAIERGRLAATLRIVREVIRSLAPVAGRKSMVLVTTGFPVDPSLNVFREVRDQAARANVALTYLDPRGLPTGPPLFSAAGKTGGVGGPDVGLTLALWRMNEEGPKTLADETGGVVLQTNDLAGGLAKVAEEARVTYLLGYEPTNDKRDGRYRKLHVELRRPGLQVRARAGYFAAKGAEKHRPDPKPIDRALGGLFDEGGIPLRLAAYVMGPAPVQSPVPKTGVEVLIAGEVRLDALQAEVKDGRRVAEPKLKLVTASRAGESHESEWSLQITLGQSLPESVDALWHPFVTRIAMTPGDHRARLVVQSGERLGSVTADFIVPPLTEERLSTPILSDRLVVDGSDRRVLPLARRSFGANTTLHCWIEIQAAALDNETGQPRVQASFVARSLDGREWASGPPTAMKAEGGRVTRLLDLPLADAPTGEHELVLRVRDEVSGATFETREPFRVERSPAGRAAASSAAPDALSAPSPGVVAAAPGVAPAATQAAVPPPAATQAGPPARATLAAATPTFPADTQVVVLDLVARDGRGRLVSDLRAEEFQVFEDGKRCDIQSFRLVAAARAAEASPGAGSPQAAGNAPVTGAPQPSAPNRANVVVLLFDLLVVDKAPSVREAALDLLGRSFPPNTWFAVYKVTEDGTRLLQALTSDRGRLRNAVLTATTGDDKKRFGRAVEPNTAETPSPAAGLLGPPSSSAGDLAARAGTGEQGHFRGREELATFSGMQWIVSSLADVRGRKAIVYFAADHQLGGGEISGGRASLAYAAAMSDANRANVTIHTMDARGLTPTRVGDRSAFNQVAGQSAAGGTSGGGIGTESWTTATEPADKGGGPLLGDPERVGSPKPEKFLSYRSGSLLEHVAEETGGLAIRNTNDLAAGLARVIDELREYYEVVYTPPNPVPDGRFRRIEVKVSRRGVQVRTRAGYFATPETTPTIPRSSLR